MAEENLKKYGAPLRCSTRIGEDGGGVTSEGRAGERKRSKFHRFRKKKGWRLNEWSTWGTL